MRRAAALIALAVFVCVPVRAQNRGPDLRPLLDAYLHRDFDAAVAKAAAITDLGPFRLRFVQDTPAWINADSSQVTQRTNAAAAFLLEVTAARLESDWGRFADLIEWTCVQLRAAPPSAFERAWHGASHALAGRARARRWLLGATEPVPKGQVPPPAHLLHAVERFPDDPGFQLSRAVAESWGRDGEPMRNTGDDPPASGRMSRTRAQTLAGFEALFSIDAIAPEAHLHAGMMRFAARDYAAALREFETASSATDTPITYIAHLNAGRALEALSRPDYAMREYQRALEIVPNAESATIALASLQFMRDDREPALAELDHVFNHTPGAPDPGRLFGYGSFFRWSALKANLRLALSAHEKAAQ
jgi:tetratricopeptide (TPR) repeat protein